MDHYDNATKTLTPNCVKHIDVEAEGLDRSAVVFTWQVGSETLDLKLRNYDITVIVYPKMSFLGVPKLQTSFTDYFLPYSHM